MPEERIAVITDGSLPSSSTLVQRVVPFYVQYYRTDHSGRTELVSSRQDQISIEEFLEIQRTSNKPIGTAQPTPNDFLKAYLELFEQGFNRMLVLTVPQTKSGTFTSASLAARQFAELKSGADVDFGVVDTGTTAAGIEYLAYEAVKLVNQGEFFAHIVERIERLARKIELFLTIDKIDYISASGRIEELSSAKLSETLKRKAQNLAAWFARKIHHSPKVVITLVHGKEKIAGISRFFHQATEIMVRDIEQRVRQGKGIQRVYLYKRNADFEAEKLLERLLTFSHAEVIEKDFLPVALLAFTGPKYLAAICIYD